MKIVILHHQSLLDLAIQHTGAVENAFDLALQNNRSITDDLESGSSLITNGDWLKANSNKDILSYYQAKKIQPATAISGDYSAENSLQGIDYWAIQMDFIVS